MADRPALDDWMERADELVAESHECAPGCTGCTAPERPRPARRLRWSRQADD